MKSLTLFIFLSSIWITTHAQSIIYVDATNTGSQNGQSWSTAYSDLQDAISASSAGDSIFVANGEYYPSIGLAGSTDPRDRAFLIPTGVALFGGFVGNESSITDRSLDSMSLHVTNRTRLSGDIGTLNDDSDNCYHVVVSILSSNSTLVDGFTISDANANGQDSIVVNGVDIFRKYGGGLNLTTSFLTLANCVVRDNVASRGGGGINNNDSDPNIENSTFYSNSVIWNDDQDPNSGGGAMRNDASHPNIYQTTFHGNDCYAAQGGGAIRNENASNPTIDHSRIRDNSTTFGGDGGAGMYNATGSAPNISNCRFLSNYTQEQGGAMYNDNSTPIVSNSLFQSNIGAGGAGAIESDGGSHMELLNCEFFSNSTDGDGGALQNWKSSPSINDCLFVGNHADGDGGAIFNYNECSPWISNSTFRNNSCDENGGAIYNRRDCNPVLTQLLIYDNYAGMDGGGIYTVMSNNAPCSPIATNVTIVRNEAGNSGGGAFDDGMGSSRLKNSIVLGNIAQSNNEIDAPAASAATNVFYSIIGTEYYTFGSNAPTTYSGSVFIDPNNDDFHLSSSSPGINTGDSIYYASSATPDLSAITEDMDGNPRVMGSNIDLGVYEVCPDTLIPEVSISVAPSDSVADSTIVTFSSNANVTSITQYQWLKNGTAISGATDSAYVAQANVDFVDGDLISLKMESNQQCAVANAITFSNEIEMMVYAIADTTDTTNNDTIIGIWENSNTAAFHLYPNPTNYGILTIETDEDQVFKVSIFELTGRMVFTETASARIHQVNVSNLQPSTYAVSVKQSDGSVSTKRLIITR